MAARPRGRAGANSGNGELRENDEVSPDGDRRRMARRDRTDRRRAWILCAGMVPEGIRRRTASSRRWRRPTWPLLAAAARCEVCTFKPLPGMRPSSCAVLRGAAYVVAVDLRSDSPTRLNWAGVELTADNRRALYVPTGCARLPNLARRHRDVLPDVAVLLRRAWLGACATTTRRSTSNGR